MSPQAPRSRRKKAPETPLTRERIVAVALQIVDREGAGALSMRRLGAELGVDPMAVYYHVPNKEALLDAIVEAVMAEIDVSRDDPAASPEQRVMWAARAYRDVMLAHANALPIVLTHGPRTPGALRPVELLIGIFVDAGLPPEQALAGMNAVAATVRGMVAMVAQGHPAGAPGAAGPSSGEEREATATELPVAGFPHLYAAMTCAHDFIGVDFDFGVRALVRGLLASAAE